VSPLSRFVFSQQAEDDLLATAEYLDDEAGKAAAYALIDRVYSVADLLAAFPLMGTPQPRLGHNVRSTPVGRHTIVYRVHDDFIYVIRILHQRQDIDETFGTKQ
jgi:toxin ParE1/3/4